MLLESSIMLLESSVMLLENIYSTGLTNDDCNMFNVQATTDFIQCLRNELLALSYKSVIPFCSNLECLSLSVTYTPV